MHSSKAQWHTNWAHGKGWHYQAGTYQEQPPGKRKGKERQTAKRRQAKGGPGSYSEEENKKKNKKKTPKNHKKNNPKNNRDWVKRRKAANDAKNREITERPAKALVTTCAANKPQ
jgi:hypothetical protein